MRAMSLGVLLCMACGGQASVTRDTAAAAGAGGVPVAGAAGTAGTAGSPDASAGTPGTAGAPRFAGGAGDGPGGTSVVAGEAGQGGADLGGAEAGGAPSGAPGAGGNDTHPTGGEAGASAGDGGLAGAVEDCECTSGKCCDGCHFLGPDHLCFDETWVVCDTQVPSAHCVGVQGYHIMHGWQYCTGHSTACGVTYLGTAESHCCPRDATHCRQYGDPQIMDATYTSDDGELPSVECY